MTKREELNRTIADLKAVHAVNIAIINEEIKRQEDRLDSKIQPLEDEIYKLNLINKEQAINLWKKSRLKYDSIVSISMHESSNYYVYYMSDLDLNSTDQISLSVDFIFREDVSSIDTSNICGFGYNDESSDEDYFYNYVIDTLTKESNEYLPVGHDDDYITFEFEYDWEDECSGDAHCYDGTTIMIVKIQKSDLEEVSNDTK